MKVLIIKIAAIGDFLMATPALRALKLADSVESVSLLAGRSLEPVVRDNPHLDRVFYVNDRRIFHGGFWGKSGEVIRVAWRLRREKFDVGFNFHRDWRFNIILFLAGCKRRIGFAGGRKSMLLTDAVRIAGVKHHVFHYCDLLKKLGIFCLDFKLEFALSADALAAAADKFLRPESLEHFVVIAPGGAANVKEEMESRRWPGENFAALAAMLLRDGRRVALLGGEGDVRIAAAIKAACPGIVDWSGKTTLAEAAALLKKSQLLVCNDAGLMHLGEAVGARVISLFGPTDPREKKPLSAGNVAVWKGEGLECAPCYHDGVFPRCEHLTCLKAITPEEIFNLISK